MHSILWRYVALLIGICAIINALSIPAAHDGSLTLYEKPGPSEPSYSGVERRGSGAGDKTTPKASKSKKTRPTPKLPKKSKGKTLVVGAIAPSAFDYLKSEDKAVNICSIGLECTSEDEPLINPAQRRPKSKVTRIVKLITRAPPTTFWGQPGGTRIYKVKLRPQVLDLTSKPYWTGPDLYDHATTNLGNLKTVYATFKYDSLQAKNMYEVQASSTRPKGNYIYVTEHILESHKLKMKKNPKLIKLRNTVDNQWFIDHWNKKHAKVQTRPHPVKYMRPRNDKDETINDIVFEALGSKTNADDFVLCEKSINSVKGRLWSNQQPFAERVIENKFELAAAGFTDNSEPMSAIRTVLAVYDYMELPSVKSRLTNEIMNVKMELSMANIKHIVGTSGLPEDKTKKHVVDLAQMWDEYMERHILRFKRKGVEWLKGQLQNALKHYMPELEELETTAKRLKTENTQSAKDKRAREMGNLQRDARALKRDVLNAKVAAAKEELKFFRLKEQVDKLPKDKRADERLRVGFHSQVHAKKERHRQWFDLRVAYGKLERKAIALDDKELPKMIKAFREEFEQLEAILKLVKKMEGDIGAEEAALDLGNISIGTRALKKDDIISGE